MDKRETAMYFFRKLTYLLYLEIGSLQPKVHPQLAKKAYLKTAFFQREKERQAADLYRDTESIMTTAGVLAPYEERTGLSLEDVYRAFAEGDWRNRYGSYNFGGPKWVQIAQSALDLRRLIDQEQWEETEEVLHVIKGLKTNQGYLINQFERTDRRHK